MTDSIRDSVKEILTTEGYECELACNGLEASRLLSYVKKPCLVLLDLLMPEMDGVTFLAKEWKRLSEGEFKVIIMTAGNTKNVRNLPIVRKPFDLVELLGLSEQCCDRNGDEHGLQLRDPPQSTI